MVIAFVGSGGKTTQLKQLAEEYRRQGLRVFVTTTTHMYIEPDTLVTDDPTPIIRRLEECGYAMAGSPRGEKIASLSPETYAAVCPHADVVLVEADGSKHMPIKFPAESEPVIPHNASEILVVCGLHALGQPLYKVAHRPELVKQCLGASDDTLITTQHVERLLVEGYLLPLRRKYPGTTVRVSPSHDNSPQQREIARHLEQL